MFVLLPALFRIINHQNMKHYLFAIGLIFSTLFWVGEITAQTVIQTTNVTVVYNTTQANTPIENVTQFHFSNGNLVLIHGENAEETSIPTATIRRLELEAATTTIGGIDDWSDDAVMIYPNPTSDQLFFACPESRDITVSIFTMNGQQLISQQMNTSESLNVKDLDKGMYIIRINNQNYKFTKF